MHRGFYIIREPLINSQSHVILSVAKNLGFSLRTGSVKNLRAEKINKLQDYSLPSVPQNDNFGDFFNNLLVSASLEAPK